MNTEFLIDDTDLSSAIRSVKEQRRALLAASRSIHAKKHQTLKEVEKRKQDRWHLIFRLTIGAAGVLFSVALLFVLTTMQNEPQRVLQSVSLQQFQLLKKQTNQVFLTNNWRLRESVLKEDIVRLFIQIPQPLQLEPKYQRNYIRKSLCPQLIGRSKNAIPMSQVEIYLISDWQQFQIMPNKAISTYCS